MRGRHLCQLGLKAQLGGQTQVMRSGRPGSEPPGIGQAHQDHLGELFTIPPLRFCLHQEDGVVSPWCRGVGIRAQLWDQAARFEFAPRAELCDLGQVI